MTARHLVLVRHATAAAHADDFERPLTSAGYHEASALGSWLAGFALPIDRVVLSPSRRTRQTWAEVATRLGTSIDAVVDERIYTSGAEVWLSILRETPDDVVALVVVGHNPAVHELAMSLDDRTGTADARARMLRGLPPGGCVLLTVDAFSDLTYRTASVVDVFTPSGW